MSQRRSTLQIMAAASLAIVALVIALGVGSNREVEHLANLSAQMYRHPFTVSNALLEANVAIVEIRQHLLEIIVAPTRQELEHSVTQIDAHEAHAYKHLETVKENFLGDPSRIEGLIRTFSDWKSIRSRIIDLARGGRHEEARPMVMEQGEGGRHFARLTGQMSDLIAFARTKADEFSSEGQVARKRGLTFLLVMVVAVILMTMIIFFITTIKVNAVHRQLSDSEARLRLIMDSVPVGITYVDQDERYQFCSKGFQAMLGRRTEDIIGKTVRSVVAEETYKNAEANIKRALAGEKAQHENTVFTDDGRPISVVVDYVPHRQPGGEVSGFFSLVHDVTERKDMEEQLRQAQKMEAVGQLTGGVAHDFNNLLAIIEGNLSLLDDSLEEGRELSPAAVRKFIGSALRAGRRGAELTHRLLAFSRKQVLQPVALDINLVVEGMEDLLRRTLEEDIDLSWHLECADWLAEADASELENVLLNLALNARDAMPDGGRLTIETGEVTLDDEYAKSHADVKAGDYVMLAVSDTGTGMDADTLEKAFEPFFTTKDVGKGTGLGLSMVHGFAKQSGGHVAIYSELGAGTTVRFYLPRAAATGAAALERDQTSASTGSGETILVVEDDEEVRSAATKILQRLGYTVFEAGDGETALAILEDEGPFDILLTDVVLQGGMSGPEMARAAQQRTPDMRVLFMSGYTQNALLHHGRLDLGVNLIGKPFSRTDIGAKVREVLKSST